MPQGLLNIRIATIAVAAIMSAIVPPSAPAQATSAPIFRVMIDGTPAGSATAAANLPTEGVVLHQTTNPTLPSAQVVSATQGTVMITTADTALVSTMQAWIKADNAGDKNTVQRKTVEIDRVTPMKPIMRYGLLDAWPTKIDAVDGATVITLVYERLEPMP